MKEWKPLIKRCTVCGSEFTQQKPRQKECEECRRYESYDLAAKRERNKRKRKKKKQEWSNLDANVAAADVAGMSYGKYKASQFVQTWALRGKVMTE